MERIIIYFMAVMNITAGFLILHRGAGRFGFDTYRSFLDREEKRRRTGQCRRFRRIFNNQY